MSAKQFFILHRTQWQKLSYALERFVASVCSLHWVEADLSMPTALSQRYVSLLFNKFLSSDSWGLQNTCLLVSAMTSVSTLIGEDTNDLCVPSKRWFILFGLLLSTRQCAACSHLLSRWDVALPSFRLSHRSERVVSTLSCQERAFFVNSVGMLLFFKTMNLFETHCHLNRRCESSTQL